MNNELKYKMQLMIELGDKHGADASDVILSKGGSFSLSAQNGQIDTYKVSGSQVIGIRAIKDNKIGISYTESLDNESLETAVKAAIENAKNSEVNEHE
ncbi:MAG TPA: TldD/PmbA family protein, partial [Sulfurimonas sp.]|nr:TldD/PmbA family protein [Sulfurimonas sp.]